jgi:uncharacterized protein (TIGR02145 family)
MLSFVRVKCVLILLQVLYCCTIPLQSSAQTVTIGSQIWMVKNLETVTFRNGDTIQKLESFRYFRKAGKKKQPAMNYEIDSVYDSNNKLVFVDYAYYYNWYAVSDPRGLCPVGWHVPTEHDWKVLTIFLDPEADTTKCCANQAGGKMKIVGNLDQAAALKQSPNTLWYPPNKDASNSSGFSAIPSSLLFSCQRGHWWTAESNPRRPVYAKNSLLMYNSSAFGMGLGRKWIPMGVRCLKD